MSRRNAVCFAKAEDESGVGMRGLLPPLHTLALENREVYAGMCSKWL